MMTENFTQLQHRYSQRINTVLDGHIEPLLPSQLRDAMQYSLLAGGKRIRPFLVYATGEMFGVSLSMLDAPAAAIESIHTYSLIHDDLPAMDNDDLRRGQATCHIKFGEANAILAGDALQTLAFSILSNASTLSSASRLNMIKELTTASGASGMCAGQIFDIDAEHKQINLAQLNKIHYYKTGVLIRAAVRLGMYAAGEQALKYQSELDHYAECIGLAFQVQDDILNVIGSQEKMGKPQGSDKQLEKSTYPALLGLEQAQETAQTLYQQAINALDKLPYNQSALRALADFIVKRDN